jgi:hypothetical protein
MEIILEIKIDEEQSIKLTMEQAKVLRDNLNSLLQEKEQDKVVTELKRLLEEKKSDRVEIEYVPYPTYPLTPSPIDPMWQNPVITCYAEN